MGLPVNSIVEATLEGSCCSQKILNVFHYAVTSSSSTTGPVTEIEDFLAQWMTSGAGSFKSDFLAMMPENYTLQFAVAQAVYPIRYIREKIGINEVGPMDAVQAANTQASITMQTAFAGRQFVGGKRILANPIDAVSGEWSVGYIGQLLTFCEDILAPVTVSTGGGVYAPCIWHRPPGPGTFNIVERAFPQPTVRVIRRRTVGLGI